MGAPTPPARAAGVGECTLAPPQVTGVRAERASVPPDTGRRRLAHSPGGHPSPCDSSTTNSCWMPSVDELLETGGVQRASDCVRGFVEADRDAQLAAACLERLQHADPGGVDERDLVELYGDAAVVCPGCAKGVVHPRGVGHVQIAIQSNCQGVVGVGLQLDREVVVVAHGPNVYLQRPCRERSSPAVIDASCSPADEVTRRPKLIVERSAGTEIVRGKELAVMWLRSGGLGTRQRRRAEGAE